MTVLSDETIVGKRDSGHIVIEPFKLKDVNTASYDVRLGPWFFREQPTDSDLPVNFYSSKTPEKMWGRAQYAERGADWMRHHPEIDWQNVSRNEQIIVIKPQENLLCHTLEFIGGRVDTTTEMKARSTIGRNLLNVCQCAGQGDVGYFNRWTMEVYNRSPYRPLILVVGRRIAQIVFHRTDKSGRSYGNEGHYQDGVDVTRLISAWHPEMMLARAHTDRDIPSDAVR